MQKLSNLVYKKLHQARNIKCSRTTEYPSNLFKKALCLIFGEKKELDGSGTSGIKF